MNVLDKIVSFSQNRSLIVAYGDHDPPEFQRQSREMAEVSHRLFLDNGIIFYF